LLLGAAREIVGGLRDLAGIGANALRRRRNDRHGLLHLRDRGVEVVLHLLIGGRERLVDAEGQVALRQLLVAMRDDCDDALLVFLAGHALGFGAAALGFARLALRRRL